jgi:hypothetical protein
LGDFTGDGLTDLYVYKADAYGRAQGVDADYVFAAKGDGTFSWVTLTGDGITGSDLAYYRAFTAADFTGDGLADVYLAKADEAGRVDSTSGVLLVGKGNGRFANTPITITGALGGTLSSDAVAAVGDFNGDGAADLYTYSSTRYLRVLSFGHEDRLRNSQYGYPDLLTSITNGLDLSSWITYKPLTDSSVYTRGSGAAYPAAEVTAARYVVSQVSAGNGIGGTNTQSYSYEGLRTHVAGEGALGFAKMIAKDDATGINTTSVYSQDYANHIQGMLTQSTVTTSNGIVLEQRDISWQAAKLTTADGTPRYLRTSPQSTTVKRDLNGASLGFTSESLTFDSYGFTLTHRISTSYNGSSVTKYTVNSYSHNVSGGYPRRAA